MAAKRKFSKLVIFFAMTGLICFCTSLFLPSISFLVLGGPADFVGFQAIGWAIGLGYENAINLSFLTVRDNLKFLLWGCAACLNIVFFATPLILLRDLSRPKSIKCLALFSISGFIFGVAAPLCRAGKLSFLIGYFIWLTGYVFVFVAAMEALRQLRKE